MDVELFNVLGFYAKWIGSQLSTFQENLSIPPAMVFLHCVTLEFVTDICPETLVTIDPRCITSQKNDVVFYSAAEG